MSGVRERPIPLPSDIHRAGAHEFGELWLAVNVEVTRIAGHHPQVSIWQEPWKTVLPRLAWAWCADMVALRESILVSAREEHMVRGAQDDHGDGS